MKDDRTLRQVVIDRVKAYIHGIEYYDPEAEASYEFDYDTMTDKECVQAFERVMWDSHRIKREHRENNPDPRTTRR